MISSREFCAKKHSSFESGSQYQRQLSYPGKTHIFCLSLCEIHATVFIFQYYRSAESLSDTTENPEKNYLAKHHNTESSLSTGKKNLVMHLVSLSALFGCIFGYFII